MQKTSFTNEKRDSGMLAKGIGPRVIFRFVLLLLVVPLILFGTSGRLSWLMAWLYVFIYLGSILASRMIIMIKAPDLLSERTQFLKADGITTWDKRLVPLVALYGPWALLLVAGLDKRFSWSFTLPLILELAAVIVLLIGTLLGVWAISVNKFFSSVVRIQTDRGQKVITGGPYRYIRHPAYAGNVLSTFATAVMLGSLWSLIPAALVVIGLFIRTYLEDRVLYNELVGYKEYAQQTKKRLIPGIW